MINVKTKLLYSFSPRIKPVINGIIAIAKFIIKQIKVLIIYIVILWWV